MTSSRQPWGSDLISQAVTPLVAPCHPRRYRSSLGKRSPAVLALTARTLCCTCVPPPGAQSQRKSCVPRLISSQWSLQGCIASPPFSIVSPNLHLSRAPPVHPCSRPQILPALPPQAGTLSIAPWLPVTLRMKFPLLSLASQALRVPSPPQFPFSSRCPASRLGALSLLWSVSQPHRMACRFPDPARASEHHPDLLRSPRPRADVTSLLRSLPRWLLGRNEHASAQQSVSVVILQLGFLFLSLPLVWTLLQGRDSGSFITVSPILAPACHTCWMDGWIDGVESLGSFRPLSWGHGSKWRLLESGSDLRLTMY